MSSDETEWARVEALIARAREAGPEALGPEERALVAIAELDTEISLNGLSGFYFNSSGRYAVDAVEALDRIGAGVSADLIRMANAMFPGGAPPLGWEERRDALEALPAEAIEQIDALGAEYLERPDELGERFRQFLRTVLGSP